MTVKTEKTYKEKKLKEIMNAIDGLFNSDGGKLELRYDKSPPKKHVDGCIRTIEQKIMELTGAITMALYVQMNKPGPQKVTLNVVGPTNACCLFTLNYNLCFPSDHQVISVPSSEPMEKVKDIMEGKTPTMSPILLESHAKHFVKGQQVDFRESKTTQFKNLKAQKSKNISLADRITGKNNKFPCYVSAYANYRGGHVYCGINDDGIVEGEVITDKDKDEIVKKAAKVIDKMIWPEHCSRSERRKGKQWEVYFEPVKDSEGISIPSTFVIVIYVAQCQGGVFTEEPECYHIVDNKVKKMDFCCWKNRVFHPDFDITKLGCPRMNNDQDSYGSVYQILTKLLNNNCTWSELKQASESAESSSEASGVKLICLSKLVAFCFRRGDFSKAEDLLEEYKTILGKSQNTLVFEVMEQYLRCAMERIRGDYEKSHNIAKVCLEKLEQIPAGIISAAFYVLTGTVVNILAIQEQNSARGSSLINDAKTFYNKTKEHLEKVQGFPSARADLEQKMYTNLAILNLGSSLSGDITDQYEDFGNVKTAEYCLEKIHYMITHDKYPLSDFREIQHCFALSCLYYRSSHEESLDRRIELLQDAMKFSKKAEKLATDCELVEMINYSKKRVNFLQDKIRSYSSK